MLEIGQKWDRAKMGSGKNGIGQKWDRAKMGSGKNGIRVVP
jgi:hypothetical protein